MKLRQLLQISLFWRTFMLLVAMLLLSSLVWSVSFKAAELESRAQLTAKLIAASVNLMRSSLMHTDPQYRAAFVTNIADQEGLYIRLREPKDKFFYDANTSYKKLLKAEVHKTLGIETVVSDQVNGVAGLWVSFDIQNDPYWLHSDTIRLEPNNSTDVLYWVALAIALSLVGSLVMAGFLNRPLKHLSKATQHVRQGHFDRVKLNERVFTTEIQQVYSGFNKMTAQLSKVESDRIVMLAGISHDLRTPLARLRLETELSVPDAEARHEMSQDIEQINAILGKFLDYARSHESVLQVVNLAHVISAAVQVVNVNAKDAQDIQVTHDVSVDLQVMSDAVELQRVIVNLLENARRYGKSTVYPAHMMARMNDTPTTSNDADYVPQDEAWSPTRWFDDPLEIAKVDITAHVQGDRVLITVRDHGEGVSPDALSQLNVPFFRANEARSNVTGIGLGLAIVEKAIQGMQGTLTLSNWGSPYQQNENNPSGPIARLTNQDGGFMAEISLKRPTGKAEISTDKA